MRGSRPVSRRGFLRSRPARLAASLASILLASVAVAPAAQAKPDADVTHSAGTDPQLVDNVDPAILATMRKQSALEPAATILTEAAMKIPGSGFASLAFQGDGLVMYWKGALPASMTAALATTANIGPVSVRPARYSLAELTAEAARIEAVAQKRSNIQAVALNHDGSGLTVEQMPPATAAAVQAKAGRALTPAATLVAGARVPVRLTTGNAPYTFLSCPSTGCTRTNDGSPWNSGTYMSLPDAGIGPSKCTSGFGVHVPAHNATYVMTAAHCLTWHAGGGDNAYDGAGELIGRAASTEDWDKDLIRISARGWYWMWDGGPSSSFKKTVHSWGYRVINELLCQSGATSGVICGLKTDSVYYTNFACDSDGDCFNVHGLAGATQIDGQTAGRGGDSGGPVFSLHGDGVRAKGVLSAGSGSHVLFQDMDDITTSRSGPGSSVWSAAYPLTN